MQHDNAGPHSARLTPETIQRLGWEFLPDPADSRDLATSDYHLFGSLKSALRGRKFDDNDDRKEVVQVWLTGQPKEFYATGIKKLVDKWDKCIRVEGDYVEK
jgi:histone-lysine N-methyltransferase SETMAR